MNQQKLIITVALTGNVPTKKMNPNLPITPHEIAEDIKRCADAGASLFHIHARDGDGNPTLDIEIYKKIVKRVKSIAAEIVIQLSTGARAGKDWEQRCGPVRILPEMASFTTGSVNLPGIIYENSPQFIEYLAKVFQETDVKPEIEIFETGMISNALYLYNKRLLSTPLHFNFVLGAPGGMPASVKNLLFLSETIPNNSTWSVTGIGKSEMKMATASIVMGGHVRVGLEDNLYMPDGSLASNPLLVDKVVRIANELGRELANPDETRTILSLNSERKNCIQDFL